MQIKTNSISIVIVGHWNLYIFTPEWLTKEIVADKKLKIDVAMNVGLPNRYTSEADKVMIIPSEASVTLRALEHSATCLNAMEEIALNIFKKLPLTPINAFGVNYGYIEDNNPSLNYIFDLPDSVQLERAGFKDVDCFIQRAVKINNCVLNIKSTRRSNGADFDFNFHYDVKDAKDASSKIKSAVLTNKTLSEQILHNAYGLNLSSEAAK